VSESLGSETPVAGNVVIRAADATDRLALAELRLAMIRELDERRRAAGAAANDTNRADADSMREATLRWVDDHIGRDFDAWIAEVDGRSVATAGLLWFAHPPTPPNPGGVEAYVLSVYTEPGARRLGLARALMERVIEAAKAAGVRRIWLRSSEDGRRLYESMGFNVVADDYRLTLP
jgi:GNAT superfamily N-acetyltransferase